MSLTHSTHFDAASSLVDLPPMADVRKSSGLQIHDLDEHILSSLRDKVVLQREKAFIRQLDKKWSPQKEEAPLKTLLNRLIKMPDTPENRQAFATIRQTFFKEQGYLTRLLSKESWIEWAEDRTALGKVVLQLKDCSKSSSRVRGFVKSLDRGVIQRANKEAKALLDRLSHPTQNEISLLPNIQSKSSCVNGLIGGTVGFLITKHPLPLLLGLSECLSRANAQEEVGSEFQVNNYTASYQGRSSVAALSSSNFVVIWQSLGPQGSSYGVYGRIFDGPGSKVGSEFQVNNYTASHQDRPSVAGLNNGNFVVVWASDDQDGDSLGVYGQLFNGTGTKIGSEFQVNTYTVSFQYNPSVASLNNGNFVVAWMSGGQDGNGIGIYGQLFNGTGGKSGSEFQVNTYTTLDQKEPSVAGLSSGDFVVTWESDSQDGNGLGVYGQLFNGIGGKSGSEFQVNTYTTLDQRKPSVAGLSSENFVALS